MSRFIEFVKGEHDENADLWWQDKQLVCFYSSLQMWPCSARQAGNFYPVPRTEVSFVKLPIREYKSMTLELEIK